MVITGHMKLFALNNVLEQLAGVNMLHVRYHGLARAFFRDGLASGTG
jgi:hypothetical protein